MAFLTDQTEIRDIEWGKSFLWDIRFDDPNNNLPAPFDRWFPASEVEENTANLSSFEFSAGYTTYKVPAQSAPKSVRVTFYDDANHSLYDWLDNWINNEIQNFREYVTTLEDAVKRLEVVKLTPDQEIVKRRVYLVYPEDNLTFRGTSSSDGNIYSVNFYVAGIIGEKQIARNTPSPDPRTERTAGGRLILEPSNRFDLPVV